MRPPAFRLPGGCVVVVSLGRKRRGPPSHGNLPFASHTSPAVSPQRTIWLPSSSRLPFQTPAISLQHQVVIDSPAARIPPARSGPPGHFQGAMRVIWHTDWGRSYTEAACASVDLPRSWIARVKPLRRNTLASAASTFMLTEDQRLTDPTCGRGDSLTGIM